MSWPSTTDCLSPGPRTRRGSPTIRQVVVAFSHTGVSFRSASSSVTRVRFSVDSRFVSDCSARPFPRPQRRWTSTSPGRLCKEDRYAAHASGGCAGCHALLDPVGFGLENYDSTGRFRAFEPDNPDTAEDETVCEIQGQGSIEGIGSFQGPAELAELAIGSNLLNPCLVEQFYRFSSGRGDLDSVDQDVVVEMAQALGSQFDLRDALTAVVTHESFRFRREEESP